METIQLERKSVERALNQLRAAQLDYFVEDTQSVIDELEHHLRQPAVGGSVIEQIRQSFADYRRAEGCSCCRDIDAHKEAEKRLAEILKPDPYEDGIGWNWSLYLTGKCEVGLEAEDG